MAPLRPSCCPRGTVAFRQMLDATEKEVFVLYSLNPFSYCRQWSQEIDAALRISRFFEKTHRAPLLFSFSPALSLDRRQKQNQWYVAFLTKQ